jgi:hypothetical protein
MCFSPSVSVSSSCPCIRSGYDAHLLVVLRCDVSTGARSVIGIRHVSGAPAQPCLLMLSWWWNVGRSPDRRGSRDALRAIPDVLPALRFSGRALTSPHARQRLFGRDSDRRPGGASMCTCVTASRGRYHAARERLAVRPGIQRDPVSCWCKSRTRHMTSPCSPAVGRIGAGCGCIVRANDMSSPNPVRLGRFAFSADNALSLRASWFSLS